MPTTKLLNRKEVAEFFGVAIKTIQRWTVQGKLHAVRINRKLIRYDEQDVNRLV